MVDTRTPTWERDGLALYQGDAREMLAGLPEASAQMCVTSPPYFGMRDYGVAGQLGLEATPDEYVARMVEVFREVRRVLRDDGTLWLNLGDCYANDEKWGGSTGGKHAVGLHGDTGIGRGKKHTGLKPKDLVGIPWRVAFALQADGWTLRSDIVWSKPNPMPESVRDRPTKSHEYMFLLAKSKRYYYDTEAVKEPAVCGNHHRTIFNNGPQQTPPGTSPHRGLRHAAGPEAGRNLRSVWTVATHPFKGAHFATFPPKLIEPCIRAGSRPGGLVLDPFSGAGTTGVVCAALGRRYVRIELSPAYVAMSIDRLQSQSQGVGQQCNHRGHPAPRDCDCGTWHGV